MSVEIISILLISFFIIVFSRSLHTDKLWSRVPKWGAFQKEFDIPKTTIADYQAKKSALKDVRPYELPPLQLKTSSRMAMGLKRLDESNWLTIDSNYLSEHTIRSALLKKCHPQVLQCLPGSEAACREALTVVTSFLTSRYPQSFSISNACSDPLIHNHFTGESFRIGQECSNPLETAVKLTMEDLNILIKDAETGEYRLMASATLFPAGWRLEERIGASMAVLHGPVPNWKKTLGKSVDRYFDHLNAKTRMERGNIFIQANQDLFQDGPEIAPAQAFTTKDLMVRRERQTFTRLERSDAVLFTVRTYMIPLVDLRIDEIQALQQQISGWDEAMAAYKGFAIWGDVTLRWCNEMLAKKAASESIDGDDGVVNTYPNI